VDKIKKTAADFKSGVLTEPCNKKMNRARGRGFVFNAGLTL
jgi:hypothetical protein